MTKKRILSLMLVLILVLSTFVSVLGASEASESAQERLFGTLVEKFDSLKEDVVKLYLLVKAVDDNDDSLMRNIEAELELEENEEARNILLNNGITKEKTAEFIQFLRSELPSSLDDLDDETSDKILVKLLLDDNPEYSRYASNLNNLATELYEIIPQEVKDDLGRYEDTKQGKIDFLCEFVNAFLDSEVGIVTYDVKKKEYIGLDLKVPSEFKGIANGLLSNPLEEGNEIQLSDSHIASINALLNVVESQIETVDKINDAGYILEKAGLVEVDRVNESTDPGPGPEPDPTPGGDTGGDSSSDEDEPKKPTVPTDPEKPVTVEVGKDNTKVEVKDGVSTVTVDEEALIDAVKQVAEAAKKAGAGRKAEVVLSIADTTDANLSVALPGNVINTLKNSNVDLVVKSNNIEYNVPAGLLADANIPEDATIEFKSKEVEVREVNELAAIDGDAKKVIELSLEILSNDSSEKVSEFSAYLTVKVSAKGLGDPDKLVVYYVNEETGELEYVSGKVKDGMLVMNINHYSKYVVVERNVTFADTGSHWAKKYVESMAAKHIIDGVGDGTFKPNDKVTRSQFIKLLVSALNLEEVKYNGEFTDVNSDMWYANYVATALANGLTDGYVDGTFRPDQEISRVEMAVMLSRALTDVEVDYLEVYTNVNLFNDGNDVADWATNGVAKAVKAKLMEGIDGNRFAPNDVSTRAEAATVVYRLFNR